MSDRDFETGERMKDETQPHDLQQASPLYVASLARGMVLLESFRDGAPLLGITDLVRITGFEKNLVQRLTNTLYQMGYLGKDQTRRKYYLTPRILTHSFNYLRSRKLFALAMPALIDLREDLRKAVNMCVLNGTDITYVVRLWLKYYHEASLFGESLPAYSSAGGRMLLSFFSDEDALALIESMERRKLTPHTRVDPMELLDEVRKAREQGYCWQAGEFIEKEISVSAPVSDADGKPAVNESKCIGCGACRKICAHDAPTIENRKMHIDTNKCVGCGRCIAVCPMDAIEGVYDPNGHLLNCKMAEYAKAVVQGRPSFHISLAMDISPNCDCHAENDVPVIPNVGMFASFDPVALDEACAEMCSRMPRNPNAAFEDASSDDLFHAVHTVTHWQDQTEHGEKIGLGSREYELIEI